MVMSLSSIAFALLSSASAFMLFQSSALNPLRRSNAKGFVLISPGAVSDAMSAASIATVPEPQNGSRNTPGFPSLTVFFHSLLDMSAAARCSLSTASVWSSL